MAKVRWKFQDRSQPSRHSPDQQTMWSACGVNKAYAEKKFRSRTEAVKAALDGGEDAKPTIFVVYLRRARVFVSHRELIQCVLN